ncbi:MAG: hypothetical protein JWM74_5828 [Myxococcaceae bacterium]|jgi:hypothetical protein|nr:hypothetical protein [Myxococcaceae bacterium]
MKQLEELRAKAKALTVGTVDRSFARFVALKRIFTGLLALVCGAAIVAIAMRPDHPSVPSFALVLVLAIFFGGGLWTLRDGIRLRRELRK